MLYSTFIERPMAIYYQDECETEGTNGNRSFFWRA